MARRGMMTALQAALAGVAGGLEGRAQQQAADEEKKRMEAALARQQGIDKRQLDAEERAINRQNMLDQMSLIGAGYSASSPDMPGATPRTPFDTQTVGGKTFSRYDTPEQEAHREATLKERAANRAKALDASLKVPAQKPIQYTKGERGIAEYDPNTKTSAYVPYPKGFTQRVTGGSGKSGSSDSSKGVTAAISGAGKIVASTRMEETKAQSALDRVLRQEPDEMKFTGSQEELDAKKAAWQRTLDAAEKKLADTQDKYSRVSQAYESALVSRDTTGFGEAFPTLSSRTAAATPKQDSQELALAKSAAAKIGEWQSRSDEFSPEEISAAVQRINSALRDSIQQLRSKRK